MNRRLLGTLVVLIVGGGALWFWQGRAAQTPPAPVVAAGPVGVGALGRVEPASRVRKLSQPGGFSVNRVGRLLVAEGDAVSAGQLLAELSDAEQKDAAVTQAQAAVAESRARLAKTRAAGRPSEIEAQQARIQALWAVEDMARRDAERAEKLATSGAGASASAERSRSAAARAAAERAEAKAQLDTLANPRAEDVAVAEAQVLSAEATLARARADADLSRVRAPMAGTILKIHAFAGDPIGNDGLLEMADLGQIDIVADVYETDLPRLRDGAEAEVIVPGETRRYRATVREIGWIVRRSTQATSDPIVAVDSRTVEVRLALGDDGRDALKRRVNMQVQVAIKP